MSRLIIDITELVDWTGKLTGVPRVMNELASRFSREDDAVFGHWNKDRRIFEVAEYIPPKLLPDEGGKGEKRGFTEELKKLIRHSSLASKTTAIMIANLKRVKRKVYSLGARKEELRVSSTDTFVVLADWHGSDPSFIGYVKNIAERGTRIIQVSYDLLPLVAPQYSGHSTNTLEKYVKNIYPLCEQILAISKHTKLDIEQWLKHQQLRVPPVQVIRLGDDFKIAKAVSPKHKRLKKVIKDKFFLVVGTVEARKNHTLLYYAYKQAFERGIELPPAVIVGRAGWLAGDIYQIMNLDPDVKEKFIFVDNISDSELSWLYVNCYCTIYPSFYEGWGLPVAESIAHGIPCLCSNTSSIPEIAGDLLQYFSPYDPAELLRQMQQILKADVYEASKKAIATYMPTSWDDTYNTVRKSIIE